jgi:hypothetical protein
MAVFCISRSRLHCPLRTRVSRTISGEYMCNLYSMTKGPQAIRDFARATRSDARSSRRFLHRKSSTPTGQSRREAVVADRQLGRLKWAGSRRGQTAHNVRCRRRTTDIAGRDREHRKLDGKRGSTCPTRREGSALSGSTRVRRPAGRIVRAEGFGRSPELLTPRGARSVYVAVFP